MKIRNTFFSMIACCLTQCRLVKMFALESEFVFVVWDMCAYDRYKFVCMLGEVAIVRIKGVLFPFFYHYFPEFQQIKKILSKYSYIP